MGCTGGDACVLITGVAANAGIMTSVAPGTSPSFHRLLPNELLSVFTRPVCEALVLVGGLSAGDGTVDFSSSTYTDPHAVLQAVLYGRCSPDVGIMELGRRAAASESAAVGPCRGASWLSTMFGGSSSLLRLRLG